MTTRIARLAVCLIVACVAAAAQAGTAKNVILLISDGQGFNHVLATEMYRGSQGVYQSFPTKVSMATFSANSTDVLAGGVGYDPVEMAENFDYVNRNYTDSASAASAMYTGQKIWDGDINMTPEADQKPLTTFFEQAAKNPFNKSMGAVSSVQITHATPGAVYGHNVSRNNYAEIGTEGVYGSNPSANNAFYDALNYNGNFTVLMGAGHGDYDNDGQYNPGVNDKYAGGTATWQDIVDGAAPNGWTFVENKADFEAIAAGTGVPSKLLGIAQVNSTLQQSRSNPAGDFDPMNTNVPTLETMTKAALNVLGQNPNGFTVMIEGGAVDWAGHGNQLDRMIEEQIDFDNSVQAAVDWVEANSNWDETLIIVTADHETGWLAGPGGCTFTDNNGNGTFQYGVDELISYNPMVNNGAGNLPSVEWFSGNHTNQLVPLFAKGPGSELFADYIVDTDPNLDGYYGLAANGWTGFTGEYIDNTSVFTVMTEATGVPEPTTLALLGLGALAALRRRRA